MKVLTKYEVIK